MYPKWIILLFIFPSGYQRIEGGEGVMMEQDSARGIRMSRQGQNRSTSKTRIKKGRGAQYPIARQ